MLLELVRPEQLPAVLLAQPVRQLQPVAEPGLELLEPGLELEPGPVEQLTLQLGPGPVLVLHSDFLLLFEIVVTSQNNR